MTNPREYPDVIQSAESGRPLYRGVKMLTITVDGQPFTYGQSGWWASLDDPAGEFAHNRIAVRMAHFDDAQRIVALRQHAPGHDQVCPGEIVIGQGFGIAIDEPHLPGFRQ